MKLSESIIICVTDVQLQGCVGEFGSHLAYSQHNDTDDLYIVSTADYCISNITSAQYSFNDGHRSEYSNF